jgi:Ca-activated chloride channel homolog
MMIRVVALASMIWAAGPAKACDTALMLAIDVSNSVDPSEYRLQVDGLADALVDPEIVEAMVKGQVAIAIMQWSGVDRQVLTTGWTQIRTADDATNLSLAARITPRAITLSDTAPAEAIYFALDQFAGAPVCRRQVIDISGDGTPNAGSDAQLARNLAQTSGVTINGIAIEGMGRAISAYYRSALITRDGFVVTAQGHVDYHAAIHDKILRELSIGIG